MAAPAPRLLIVDDEPDIRFGVRDFLESKGYDVEEAESCAAALAVLRRARPDVVVADYLLPDGNALELLPQMLEVQPGVPVVLLTAHGSIDLAVRAIKLGAEQFLTKPVELPALLVVLERLLDNQRNRKQQIARKRQTPQAVDPFAGTSDVIRTLQREARKVVTTDRPVLILGETGAGKGVLARWLHAHGSRGDEAFVDINCAGLSRELLEAEMFGYERGAFTGAASAKVGLLEVADRGTVFLDEIGDMDPQVQAKLLKVLEEQQFRRLGEVRDRRVDVRLIAATHRDLATLVKEKRFRQDLYFRISTLPLAVPSLRERREDIPLLAAELLRRLGPELGRGSVEMAPDALRALQEYAWPGNVRELKNVLERALLLSDENTLRRLDLRFESGLEAVTTDADGTLTLRDLERLHIRRVLQSAQGRVDVAAQRLGIPRSSLYQKLKQYGIEPSGFRNPGPNPGQP